jgi:DHA1 family tetracycline resistance protein-like MFS transporter
LLDFMGFTISATILPDLFLNHAVTFLPQSMSTASRLAAVGVTLGLYPLGQFLSASILGELSDIWGRRSILLYTVAGTLIFSCCTALSIYFSSIMLLLISRFCLGLFAGNVSVAQATMMDISDFKHRAKNISLIQLSLGLAWVFGAPLGGLLIDKNLVAWFSYSTPFWLLSIMLLATLLILFVSFKETLKEFRVPHRLSLFNGVRLTYQAFSTPQYNKMFFIWMLFIGGWAMFLQFLPTFLLLNFNYSASTIGPMLAFMGGTFACTQIFIARRILSIYSPEKILLFFLSIPGLAALGMALSTSWLQLHVAAFFFPFVMGFTLPGLLASLANLGGVSEQGIMLGRAQSIQAIMTVMVTLVGGQLLGFNKYLTTYVGALMMLSAWLMFVFYMRSKSKVINCPS